MRRLAASALVAVLAACGSSTSTIGVGLSQPSAVVTFRGYTPDPERGAQLRPLFAIANAGRGDLTLVDAEDDKPVLAPVIVRSLAVPVPDPRPSLLVASPLGDGTGQPLADLLVVASTGTPALQLVETWVQSARVVDEADLGALAPGAQILAAAAVPVVDVAGAVVPGRVRVVVALTGGRLAVVEYARSGEAIVRGDTTLRPLTGSDGAPFDAVSLAASPHDPLHLYAASPDPIGGVEGVAELRVAGAPAEWTVRGLSARAPTRFVATARLRERRASWPASPFGMIDDTVEFETAPVDRVYAVIDPTRCGPNHRINCGIAVLDPVAGGIVPDYAGLMPYLAPIALPELALGLAAAEPPAVKPDSDANGMGVPNDGFMKIAPGTGTRLTTAVAAIPSGSGRIYYADLGRWAVPNDQSILRTSTRTSVTGGVGLGVAVEGETLPRVLGVWYLDENDDWQLGFEAPEIQKGARVTPGFTVTETFQVAFQAPLPGLEAHRAQSGRTADGRTWVAMQVPASVPGGTTLTQVVRVYDPTFAARAGDIVEIYAPGVAGCPTDGNVEARVAELLPPEEAYPGGALALEPLDDPRPQTNPDGSPGPWRDWPACVQALGGGGLFQAGVRAAELVAFGTSSGYAGRPEPARSLDVDFAPAFALQYENEDVLEADCPLLPWPADWRSAPAEFRACDATCRGVCERLVLARKARRIYHVSDQCAIDDVGCHETWPVEDYPFPRANGPVIAFKVGYRGSIAEGDLLPAGDRALWGQLRGMLLTIATRGGLAPSSRLPTTSSTSTAAIFPLGASTFDRSAIPAIDNTSDWAKDLRAQGYRFLVPYPNEFVLDFSPGEAVSVTKVIR